MVCVDCPRSWPSSVPRSGAGPSEPVMEPTAAERNSTVVRALVQAINSDLEDVPTYVAEGFVRHSTAAGTPQVRSPDDLLRLLRVMYVTSIQAVALKPGPGHMIGFSGEAGLLLVHALASVTRDVFRAPALEQKKFRMSSIQDVVCYHLPL